MPSPRSLLDRLLGIFARPPADAGRGASSDEGDDEGEVEAPAPPPGPPFDIPDELAGPTRRSRKCHSRREIHQARVRLGKAKGPLPPSMPCPSREELVELGLFEPTRQPSMSGTDLVDGPFRVDRQCCYDLQHWWTGRPLLVGCVARRASLRRAAAFRPAARWSSAWSSTRG